MNDRELKNGAEAKENPQKVIRRLMIELGEPMPEECSALEGLCLISKTLQRCRDAFIEKGLNNENQN